MKPHYGGRLFTHYYNKRYKIKDSKKQFSEPVKDKKLLKKSLTPLPVLQWKLWTVLLFKKKINHWKAKVNLTFFYPVNVTFCKIGSTASETILANSLKTKFAKNKIRIIIINQKKL